MKHKHEQEKTMPRLVYFPELKRLTGLSRSTVWKLEKTGSFPRRRLVTTNRIAWLENEVQDWIISLAAVEGTVNLPKCNLRGGSVPETAGPDTSTPVTPSTYRPIAQGVRKRRSWRPRTRFSKRKLLDHATRNGLGPRELEDSVR